jgi:DNA helicase HerA-like ATPase
VGVYFVTQNPLDLPAAVLGQLGNRVQHALRASHPPNRRQCAPPQKPSAPTRSSGWRTR